MEARLFKLANNGLLPHVELGYSNTTTLGRPVVEGQRIQLHYIGGLMYTYEVLAVAMGIAVLLLVEEAV
jgi:hypothetical protein